jgi:signal transduction histidine kinase
MKKFTAIAVCIFLICGAMFYFISMRRNSCLACPSGLPLPRRQAGVRQAGAIAEDGILDLTGEDFTNTIFRLDGEWEFYYGQLLAPDDFANGIPESGTLIQVPMSWHEAGYDRVGYATYRLTVKTNEPELLMLIPEIAASSIVWINGHRIFEAGNVSVNRAEVVPRHRNAFVTFRPENGRAEIIIQAANSGYMISGLNFSIETGRNNALFSDAMSRRILLCIFIGLALTMAFYHMTLFAYRRNEPVYLYFALYCLFTALRFTIETNGLAAMFLPQGVTVVLLHIYLLFITVQVATLVLFTHLVLDIKYDRKWINAVYCAALVSALLVALLPYGMVSAQAILVVIIPLAVIFVRALRLKRLRKNPYNVLFVLSVAIFVIWPLFNRIILNNALFMSAAASNLFMILSQCIILSAGYAETKRREEELTAHNEMLSGVSRMKTEFFRNMSHEIKTPLTVISVHVQRAFELFMDSGVDNPKISGSLQRAQEEIMRTARMADNALWLASTQENRERIEPLDIAELLTNSAEIYRAMIEKRGNTLNLKIPYSPPSVSGIADQLIQMMANLLTNANTHTENGKINVELIVER